MIGILIAILLAALVYWVCVMLGLPAIVAHRRRDPRPARRLRDRRLRLPRLEWPSPLAGAT